MKTTEFDYGQLDLEVLFESDEIKAHKKGSCELEPAFGIKVGIIDSKDAHFVQYEKLGGKPGFRYYFDFMFMHSSIGMNNLVKMFAEKINKSYETRSDLEDDWCDHFIKFLDKFPTSDETTFIMSNNARIVIWTSDKDEFQLILKAANEAIHDISGISDTPLSAKITSDHYFKIANSKLPKELVKGFIQAMKDYKQKGITETNIGVIIDVESSELVFVLGNLTDDDLRDAKEFSRFHSPLIKECDDLCNKFEFNNSQEACHWLTDALSIEEGIFDDIDRICIFGNYMYDEAGEMDVIFEKH